MGKAFYKGLKLSKDGLPTWDSLLPCVLKYIVEKNEKVSRMDIKMDVADSLGLPMELRNRTYNSSYKNNAIENRIDFSISALKISGLIESVLRGYYVATVSGKDYFKKYGMKLDRDIIEKTDEYIEYYKEQDDSKETSIAKIDDSESFDSLEKIDEQIHKLLQEKRVELLEVILNASPYFFEKMVVILLSKMGYKGKDGHSFVTQKSSDGGIDGIINQDPLGTQTVYVQAKRYKEANVQRQEIEMFYGALNRISANRGVFITTSDFSKTAKETAEQFSIVLINKDSLLDLLIEYEVGVVINQTFYTYKLDDDFFEEE